MRAAPVAEPVLEKVHAERPHLAGAEQARPWRRRVLGHARRRTHGDARTRERRKGEALTFSILASGVIWPKREPKVDLPKRPKPVCGSYMLTSRSVGAMNWPAGRGVGSPALPPLVEPGMPAPATSEAGFPPCKNLHVARKQAPRLKSPHSCSAWGRCQCVAGRNE